MRKKSILREWLETIATALLLYILISTFVIQSFYIPSLSMRPTLEKGDRLFVTKFNYGVPLPFSDKKLFASHGSRRGDVIVFRYPRDPYPRLFIRLIATPVRFMTFNRINLDPHKDYIKRVVGLPGEKIEIRRGKVYINGEFRDEFYAIHEKMNPSYSNYSPVEIPQGFYFVMGDNRERSSDSRVWGFLEKKYIKGKALFIYWPPKRIGIIR